MKLLSFILTLAVTSSIGYSQDLNNGLAAHWKFDDGADESVTDAGPDHLDGVQVNAEWVKSSFGLRQPSPFGCFGNQQDNIQTSSSPAGIQGA